MSALRAEDVYRRHVRTLPPEERAKLIEMIGRDLAREESTEPRHDLSELHGLGREIWDGIDAQEYVDSLRGEWDRRE